MTFIAEGATRAGYDAMRIPVSSLALGESGWMQQVNFVATGALMLGFAIGTERMDWIGPAPSRWGPRLIGLFAIGLAGAGLFVTDPVNGYPAGTPTSVVPTVHGVLHNLFSLLVFAPLIAAELVFAWRFGRAGHLRWAAYSAASGVLVALGLILFGQGFAGAPRLVDVAGLLQRVTIAIGWTWLTALALRSLKR